MLTRLKSAKNPPSGQKIVHQGRMVSVAQPRKSRTMAVFVGLMASSPAKPWRLT